MDQQSPSVLSFFIPGKIFSNSDKVPTTDATKANFRTLAIVVFKKKNFKVSTVNYYLKLQ